MTKGRYTRNTNFRIDFVNYGKGLIQGRWPGIKFLGLQLTKDRPARYFTKYNPANDKFSGFDWVDSSGYDLNLDLEQDLRRALDAVNWVQNNLDRLS